MIALCPNPTPWSAQATREARPVTARLPLFLLPAGQLATIGRMAAVAGLGKRRLTGALAWFLWLVVHIMYLADFRNRIVVLFEWAWAWFLWSRPGRIILEKGPRWPPPDPPDDGAKTDAKNPG